MFTGIIETTGIVTDIIISGSNKTFWIESSISDELSVDQSVSHNGVCLTVEAVKSGRHKLTAIEETLQKTNLNDLINGAIVNIERCVVMNGRLDGHIVQGHVDDTAKCIEVVDKNGSWEYSFTIDKKFAALIIEKGSITINGISLTIFNVKEYTFTVAIIPYTFEHTNIKQVIKESEVNVEFDIVGKYINRMHNLKSS